MLKKFNKSESSPAIKKLKNSIESNKEYLKILELQKKIKNNTAQYILLKRFNKSESSPGIKELKKSIESNQKYLKILELEKKIDKNKKQLAESIGILENIKANVNSHPNIKQLKSTIESNQKELEILGLNLNTAKISQENIEKLKKEIKNLENKLTRILITRDESRLKPENQKMRKTLYEKQQKLDFILKSQTKLNEQILSYSSNINKSILSNSKLLNILFSKNRLALSRNRLALSTNKNIQNSILGVNQKLIEIYNQRNLHLSNNGINSSLFDFNIVKGIDNLGNTCFANAFLQVFLSCSELVRFLINCRTENPLIKNIKSLIIDYYCRESDRKVNYRIVQMLLRRLDIPIGSQQDSIEYFLLFLNAIEESLNELDKIEFKNLYKCTFNNFSTYSNRNNLSTEDSVECVVRILLKKNTAEDFHGDFNRDFRHLFSKSINYINKRTLRSNTPGSRNISTNKISYITSTSNTLFIDIVRRVGLGNKITDPIMNIPHLLDVRCQDGTSKKYQLSSFIVHLGGPKGGHYISFKKSSEFWIQISDSEHEYINDIELELKLQQATLLCYQIKPDT